MAHALVINAGVGQIYDTRDAAAQQHIGVARTLSPEGTTRRRPTSEDWLGIRDIVLPQGTDRGTHDINRISNQPNEPGPLGTPG